MKITSIIALPSGATDPETGFIDHCPILNPASYFPPFPAFFAYFLTYLVSFFPPAFLGSVEGVLIFLAASNLAYLSVCKFVKSSFLNSSLLLSKIQ